MFNKLTDILREVFWLKPKKKPKKKSPAKRVSPAKKDPAKKKVALKATPKKSIVRAKAPVKAKAIDPNLVKYGEVTHYFERIKVCVVKVTSGTILVGDKVTIIGWKTKFVQKIWSMQIESRDVKVAKKGDLIGLKVDKPVVVGDIVYK